MNSTLFQARCILLLSTKKSAQIEKPRRKPKSHKGKTQIGSSGDAQPCHLHHRQPVVDSGHCGSDASRMLRFVLLFGLRVFALDHPTWAYWACLANSLDLTWLKLHTFLPILGSTHTNLQSKSEQVKIERNRRNIYIK